MALTNTNAMLRKGGDNIASSYIRIVNGRMSDDGILLMSSIKAYIDEDAYNANPGDNIPLGFNNYMEVAYDRATNGNDMLLYMNEQWRDHLYTMFPDWGDTGIDIVNVAV